MARSAAPDEENAVRAPDPQQRMRLVEPPQTIDDTFAWTDEARVQVAVQTTALLLASCVYCVGDEWRSLALALVWGNASLALSAQRERRQPAPWLQVLLASISCVLASYASRDQIEACWKWVCVFAYAVEATGWRRPTTDMIQFGFPKFQRQLFVILIAGTYWGLPALYSFADRLEFEALSAQPLGRDTGDFDTSAAASRVAGGLLYGGTIAMLALSIYVWYRMYLIAPEMFRIFAKVVGLGAAVGAALYSFGAPEVAALAAATATAFAAMAHGAMEYDTVFRRLLPLLALVGYVAYTALENSSLALVLIGVVSLAKVQFVRDLENLRGRPRTTSRYLSGGLGILHPVVTV